MVRMRARGGEENEAHGPLESEGEINSVNQSFLYLVVVFIILQISLALKGTKSA